MIKEQELVKSPLGDLGAELIELEKNFMAKARLDETIQKLVSY